MMCGQGTDGSGSGEPHDKPHDDTREGDERDERPGAERRDRRPDPVEDDVVDEPERLIEEPHADRGRGAEHDGCEAEGDVGARVGRMGSPTPETLVTTTSRRRSDGDASRARGRRGGRDWATSFCPSTTPPWRRTVNCGIESGAANMDNARHRPRGRTGERADVERAAEARRDSRLGTARGCLAHRARARPRRTRRGRPLAGLGPAARPGGSGPRGPRGARVRRPRRTLDRLGPAARRASPEHAPGRTAAAGSRAPAPPAAGGWGAAPAPGALPPGQVPGGTAPPGWNPQPVAPSNNNGCLKACLIVGVLLVILFFIGVAAVVFLGNQVVQSIGVDPEGNLETCPFVSDEELSAVLGSGTQALPLQGFFDATIGLILDKRVMPDEEDCWITSDGTNGTGRIARYQGPEAAAKFQAEKQRAQPTSEDQGGGVTIENAGYFGGDLTGFGDEAFCTGVSNAIMSGVLAPGRHPGLREPARRRGHRTGSRGDAERRRRLRGHLPAGPGGRAGDPPVGPAVAGQPAAGGSAPSASSGEPNSRSSQASSGVAVAPRRAQPDGRRARARRAASGGASSARMNGSSRGRAEPVLARLLLDVGLALDERQLVLERRRRPPRAPRSRPASPSARVVASLASLTWRANSTMTQAAIERPDEQRDPAAGEPGDGQVGEAADRGGGGRRRRGAPAPGPAASRDRVRRPAAVGRAGGRDIGPRVASPDSSVNLASRVAIPAAGFRAGRAGP